MPHVRHYCYSWSFLFSVKDTKYINICGCCYIASVVSDSLWPHRWQPTRLPIPGILQARTLECVAISFSNAWKWKVKVKSLSHLLLFATPWPAAHQAPLSMGFSRKKHWNGVPLPSLISMYNIILKDDFRIWSFPVFHREIRSHQSLSHVWLFATPWSLSAEPPGKLLVARRGR